MVSPSGAQFEGWFRDDLAHGDGILTWPDGGKFIGKYVDGKVYLVHGRFNQCCDGTRFDCYCFGGYIFTVTFLRLRFCGYVFTVYFFDVFYFFFIRHTFDSFTFGRSTFRGLTFRRLHFDGYVSTVAFQRVVFDGYV